MNISESYKKNHSMIQRHMQNVVAAFTSETSLNTGHLPIIYAVKSRVKDLDHLLDKVKRKEDEKNIVIDDSNFLEEITDLGGVRVLHLYQNQFEHIHEFIMSQVKLNEFRLKEKPIAYTWDPESSEYFGRFNIDIRIKPSYYTSIHYLLQPANHLNNVCCEVQVRTLFEEIWGEIDHSLNYPTPSQSVVCKEQLKVLAKLVSTGSRLADSIFRLHQDYR